MLRILIILIIFATPALAKEYSGSAWQDDTVKRYSGSAWVDVTKNRYSGSAWVEIEAATSDDCDNLGTWDLYWDGDHTDGFDDYCISGGTDQATLANAEASTIVAICPSGRSGNCLLLNEVDEYLGFDPSGVVASAQGTVKFDIYKASLTNQGIYGEFRDVSDNEFVVQTLGSNGRTRWDYESTSPDDDASYDYNLVESTNTLSAATWHTVQIGWQDGNQYIKVDSNTATTATQTWEAFDNEPALWKFGADVNNAADSNGIYIKNIYMKDTYEAP